MYLPGMLSGKLGQEWPDIIGLPGSVLTFGAYSLPFFAAAKHFLLPKEPLREAAIVFFVMVMFSFLIRVAEFFLWLSPEHLYPC